MKWDEREYREVKLPNGDTLLVLESYTGKDWLRFTQLFKEKGAYTAENMMARIPDLMDIFCVVIKDGVEVNTHKYFEDLDIDSVGVVFNEVSKSSEKLFSRMDEKKATTA